MSARSHRFARDESHILKAPPINTRFFYSSPLIIDDPLSPLPPPTTSTTTAVYLAPRPFSQYDNTELDRAWNDLHHKTLLHNGERDLEKAAAARAIVEKLEPRSSSQYLREARTWPRQPSQSRSRQGSGSGMPQHSPVNRELTSGHVARRSVDGQHDTGAGRLRAASRTSLTSTSPIADLAGNDGTNVDTSSEGLTGMPFARAPARMDVFSSSKRSSLNVDKELDVEHAPVQDAIKPITPKIPNVKVPVGVSRLHHVAMPDLQMEPIYWLPVHDIASVVRGTWFNKETMLPMPVDVSNMLEAGYLSLQPWTDTWSDQLNSAVEAGAAGEEKIAHPLWPSDSSIKADSRPSTAMSTSSPTSEVTPEQKRLETLAAACNVIDVMNPPDIDMKAAGNLNIEPDGVRIHYLRSSVIYANATEAYILRPSLQPSAYYGRKPLASYIKKGHKIGIPVVRGFDQNIWDRLHPPKTGKKLAQAQEGVSTSQAGRPAGPRLRSDPALAKSKRPQVTDLILVIHGIGQKLSERMESFHFTHAMNSFRREVNVELGSDTVKQHLRKDMGGIMVLPVNWRATLKMEEGGYRDEPEDPNLNRYKISDITPDSLLSVRGIISDVMLDVPYYLSDHHDTLIAAVIREANRVHRLWCLNNPDFEQYGRVHVLGHSLGSVMAVDVLSKQPTYVDPKLALEVPAEPSHLSFNTTNLYLCGSPAGLFLLLKEANIVPRRGRPGTHSNDPSPDNSNANAGVCGEQNTYGCLAIDNLYNIINPYDPVALKLNATIDTIYAASLKSTHIPSTTTSWFSFSNPLRSGSSSTTAPDSTLKAPPLPRLPSNVELETHNFTREELAEKRFALLNDNGTVDFFLRYGGGALEIQYLTMLGAHSSYWVSRDFTRFIVLETGRKAGREGTLEVCRAVKRRGGPK